MNFVAPSGDSWTTAGVAADDLPFDRELADWQGRIANATKSGGSLDAYQAALNWAEQSVPPDNGLLEKAKQEIREAAERHLADVHSVDVLEAMYFDTFPEDAEKVSDIAVANNELDAEVVKIDNLSETNAEITRLGKLTPIEFERERKSAAKRLGISLKALDAEVKAARAEDGDTKGQGRPLELPVIEPWPEPVNSADLLDDICNAVKRYLVLPEGSAETL
jgi:hypothetical protein